MNSRAPTIIVCLFYTAALGIRAAVLENPPAPAPLPVQSSNPNPFYAPTSWPTIHGDSRNSDYLPFALLPEHRVRWTALDGAALLVPPVIGPEGNLYVTSGRGPGTSHLHAFDRHGQLLWESPPQQSPADLDSRAVGGAPVVDLLGDLYVSDSNQLWAFHSDGLLKWVIDLPEPDRPLISCVLTREGFVGGVTAGGKVVFVHRQDGSSAAPILDLPGGFGPVGPPVPPGTWGGGLMDPAIITTTYHGFFGYEAEVANTPSVDPISGRIFITAAGAARDQGALYGLDFRDGEFSIAFQSPLAAGSGTSPSLSPDGSQVYAVGGDRIMVAYDAKSGEIHWRAAAAGSAASPAVGPDGTVYTGDRAFIQALNPADGTMKWSTDLSLLAGEYLPSRPRNRDTLIIPVAHVNSVISVTPTQLMAAVVVGYLIILPDTGPTPPQPRVTLLTTLDIQDGSVLSHTVVRDTSEAIISLGADGRIYFPHCSVLSSISYFWLNPQLPPRLRIPGPPPGGLTALVPKSFVGHVAGGVSAAQVLTIQAVQALGSGRLLEAVDKTAAARDQLAASLESTDTDLRDSLELGDFRVEAIKVALVRAALQLRQARDLLDTDPAGFSGQALLGAQSLEDALSLLHDRLYAPMDVQPDDCPSVLGIDPGPKDIVEVVLFGSRDFSVRDINPRSLVLFRSDGIGEDVQPLANSRGVILRKADLPAPGEDAPCSCERFVVDRFDDLVVEFSATEFVESLQLRPHGLNEQVLVKLRGTLLDGAPFRAADCILPVQRESPSE